MTLQLALYSLPSHETGIEQVPRVELGSVSFLPDENLLVVEGEERRITPKASQLLALLVNTYPRTLHKETALDKIWGVGRGSPATLAQLVRELRKTLGDDARDPVFLKTVSKTGLRLLSEPVLPNLASGRIQAPDSTTNRWIGGLALIAALLGLGLLALSMREFPGESDLDESRVAPRSVRGVATSDAEEAMPRFLPDRKGAVYAIRNSEDSDWDLAFIDFANGQVRTLRQPQSDEISPVVSAASDLLAFSRRTADSCDVMLANLNGEFERRIGPCLAVGQHTPIDFHQNGRVIAFTGPTVPATGGRPIRIVEANSGKEIGRTNANAVPLTDVSPRFSGRGTQLSFIRYNHENQTNSLYILTNRVEEEVRCGAPDLLTAHAWASSDELLFARFDGLVTHLYVLSPDRPQVCSHLGTFDEIHQLDAAGGDLLFSGTSEVRSYIGSVDPHATVSTDVVRLTDDSQRQSRPAISPDGHWLLYVSSYGADSDLRMLNMSQRSSRSLQRFENQAVEAVHWSPSGTHAVVGAVEFDSLESQFHLLNVASNQIEKSWSCGSIRGSVKVRNWASIVTRKNSVGTATSQYKCPQDQQTDELVRIFKKVRSLRFSATPNEPEYAVVLNDQYGIRLSEGFDEWNQVISLYRPGRNWAWVFSNSLVAVSTLNFERGLVSGIQITSRLDGEQQFFQLPGLALDDQLGIGPDGRIFVTVVERSGRNIFSARLEQGNGDRR